MHEVRIAVAGAGLIGRRHIEESATARRTSLAAIVDPAPAAADLAARGRRAVAPDARDAVRRRTGPDGVILATPNQLHVEGGLDASRPAYR